MARPCTVCIHDQRPEIDRQLVAGVANRALSRQYDLSKDAMARHRAHISAALVAVQAAAEEARGVSYLERIEELFRRAERFLTAAEVSGQVSAGLAAVREMRAILELLGRASGELKDSPQVAVLNVMTDASFLAARAVIFDELAAMPEVRARIAGRLLALESPA